MGNADLSDRQELLVLLTVGRQTTVDRLAKMLRRDRGQVSSLLTPLLYDRATQKVGASYRITEHGRTLLVPLLTQWRMDAQPSIPVVVHRFDALNDSFKRLLVQRLTFAQTHKDELHVLDGKISACMNLLATLEPWGRRFEGYRSRMGAAFERYLEGDERFLVDPAVDCVHLSWWELHEDLTVTTGVLRREEP